MDFPALSRKRVLVTGGSGFLGTHVVRELRESTAAQVLAPSRQQYDLRRQDAVEEMMRALTPQIVIHLAAVVGGIGANLRAPATFFYDNLIMGTLLMEAARLARVEKLVIVGTVCSYPKSTPIPFREDHLWDGYPDEANAPSGLAKKALLVQSIAYRKQYGLNSIYLLPTNLYGPGDNFSPDSSHVVPALIRKCLEAIDSGAKEIVCWGDGSATRDFLHVEDCARAILLAADRYEDEDPVNIGTDREVSIRELAHLIAEITGFRREIKWDSNRPNGQPRRRMDTRRAEERFGFRPERELRQGLEETVRWYKDNRTSLP